MESTPTTIENFYPVAFEDRGTEIYFKDANGEGMIVPVNSDEHRTLTLRYEATLAQNEEVTPEVAPETAPESTDSAPAEEIAPEATPSEEVSPEANVEAPAEEVAPTEEATIGVDLAAEGTESETVNGSAPEEVTPAVDAESEPQA